MAFTLTEANLAWQRVNIALANALPVIQQQFKALKSYLAQARNNPKLLFVPFTEAQCDAAGGTAIVVGACTFYGLYTKKQNAATDNWFWLYDDATDDTTAANGRIGLPQLVANEQNCYISPHGLILATGIVVTQYTAPLGVTDGSDGADGFVLIGA